MPTLKSLLRRALLGAGVVCVSAAVHAQTGFPVKPIRLIVGFAAGGGTDAQARIVAQALQKKYSQPVTIDNRPGAGGRLAADALAKADPDGYTIGVFTGADALLPVTTPKLPYRFPEDFQFLAMVASYPFGIVTSLESPYKTLAELLNAAKKPGEVTSASAGVGTTHHLAAELLNAMAGVEITDIAYKGSGPAMTDVIGGRVSMGFALTPSVLATGKLRALGVTSLRRSSGWPGVPAVAETVPGYEVLSWMGIAAPAKTPKAVAERLSADIQDVVNSKEVQDHLLALGLDAWPVGSTEMKARVDADIAKWTRLVRERHVKLSD